MEIDNERATDWLAKGAQPSETVEKLLNISGAMNTMKIKTGGIHVVGSDKADQPEASPEPETEATPEPAASDASTEEE